MEEAEARVDQGNAILVTGLNDSFVIGRATGAHNVLYAALQVTKTHTACYKNTKSLFDTKMKDVN